MINICVVTGNRAEFGLLKPLINKISIENSFNLQLIVTGSHLSEEYGNTFKDIEESGFIVDAKIEILLSSNSDTAISKSMGLAAISFAETFERLRPDLIILLGDRYEILSVATTALIFKIPIAHIHGGELTEGAIDDSIRHAITKMSHYHFCSTNVYRHRVIQMGEQPDRVYNVGAIGIDNIKNMKLLTRNELSNRISFNVSTDYYLITLHPETLSNISADEQISCLLDVLDRLNGKKYIFTYANADKDGIIINKKIEDFVSRNKNRSIVLKSMGQLKYLSAMKYCSCVIGNSSSGILEAPTFKVPTLNIGNRQNGRILATSIENVDFIRSDIEGKLTSIDCNVRNNVYTNTVSPYGNGATSEMIIETLREIDFPVNLIKKFYDIKGK